MSALICESWNMAAEEWARTTLTVWNGSSEHRTDLPGDTLAEQLAEAEPYLTQLSEVSVGQPPDNMSVRLFSSWSPHEGQHAMTLPPGLIKALAAANGTFWLDSYPTESAEQTP